MKRWMKMNNKGMSLVELMVVIAIITILGGVGIMGVNAMTGKPAQKCAQQIVYSLEKHRTSTMGKVSAKYVLTRDANGDIYAIEYLSNNDTIDPTTDQASKIKLGDSKMKITFWQVGSSAATLYSLESGNGLVLEFDRSSGAFKKQDDGSYCTEIIVERGGRTHKITLVPLTGKVYMQ